MNPALTVPESEARDFLAALAPLWPEAGLDELGGGQQGGADKVGAPASPSPPARLGLAVSGGPDSLALLLLAARALPGRVEAATVDHGLRAESREEAERVAEICAALGVPHEILSPLIPAGNLQSAARSARYQALGEWADQRALGAIATAHHADDQVETLMMRLNRGSGAAGLAGVRARTQIPGFCQFLLRPLLSWRAKALAEIVVRAGIEAADDPSNHSVQFDRVKMRHALAEAHWLDIDAAARSATWLADADAALGWAAEREWADNVRPLKGASGLVYRPSAPRAIRLRVLARIISALGALPRGSALAALDKTLCAGGKGNLGGVLAYAVKPEAGEAERQKDRCAGAAAKEDKERAGCGAGPLASGEGAERLWHFTPEPLRRTR